MDDIYTISCFYGIKEFFVSCIVRNVNLSMRVFPYFPYFHYRFFRHLQWSVLNEWNHIH